MPFTTALLAAFFRPLYGLAHDRTVVSSEVAAIVGVSGILGKSGGGASSADLLKKMAGKRGGSQRAALDAERTFGGTDRVPEVAPATGRSTHGVWPSALDRPEA